MRDPAPELAEYLDANRGDIIALRRRLHAYPETAFLEIATSFVIAGRLKALGYAVAVGSEVMTAPPEYLGIEATFDTHAEEVMHAGLVPREWVDVVDGGRTGVVATLTRGAGPTIAFRFDIDALPMAECGEADHRPVREGFASRRPGMMHACGHDGHAAIGVGLAGWLARPGGDWRGTVKLIFQPAEEVGKGAGTMVDAGIVDDVDIFLAGHLGCGLRSGLIAAEATEIFNSRRIKARFAGAAAHSAENPHEGRHALLAAATAAINLHALPRLPSCATRINVGRIVGGTSFNIIPADAELWVELRAEDDDGMAYLESAAARILKHASAMHDVSVTLETIPGGVATRSSAGAVNLIRDATRHASPGLRLQDAHPLGGGEDATLLMKRVQEGGGAAGYFIIGADLASGHHTDRFEFDEEGLIRAVEVFALAARSATVHEYV